jgi:hypothetical protein
MRLIYLIKPHPNYRSSTYNIIVKPKKLITDELKAHQCVLVNR